MTYEMLREKRDRVDAALLKLREGPSLSTREAGDDVLDEFMVANDAKEAADIDASSKRDISSLEKERARLTVLMDFARPALDGLSSKATPAAVAPPEPVAVAPEAPEPAAVAPTLPPPKPPAPPKLKVAAPMAPTLPSKPAPDDDDEPSSKRRKKKKRRVQGPARGPSSSAATSALEGGDVDWAPPVGQDGSGRTALNFKFGY